MIHDFNEVKKKPKIEYISIINIDDKAALTLHIKNWKIVELKKWFKYKTGDI